MTYPYRLVITRPGNLFPVVIDREISLEQRDLILETLDDEGNAYLEAGTNEARQDIAQLTHGTYDPDDDSTKTPERGYP